MKKICIGDCFQIQCYKHDGKVHRAWGEATVLDIKKEYIVFGNEKTQVIEAEGNAWKTKEPAIMYFFKDKWFNIIAQLKKDGLYFYCNIATPFIIEEKTIKYIDYDLDLRIFPNGDYKVLDELEYQYHKKIMNYSKELDKSINVALEELTELYLKKGKMFDEIQNNQYHIQYSILKKEKDTNSFF